MTCKDDGVEAGFAPQLHEVNHIPEAEGGVTGENHTGLTELAAEVSVNAGVVLQLVGLDQLKQRQHRNRSTRKTSAMILEKQLLLPVNLRRVIRPLSHTIWSS